MSDDEALAVLTRARGGQMLDGMRRDFPDINRIARTDPALWTDRDRDIIRRTLFGVVGLLLEDRIQ